MANHIIEIFEGQPFTAGLKAKQDIVKILQKEGFNTLGIPVSKNQLQRLLAGNLYWKRALKNVQPGDTVFYQYPAYSRILGDIFFKQLKNKSYVKKVIILHDIDSLRHLKNKPKDIKRELSFFNSFDIIIAHNQKMKRWLVQNNVFPPIVCLELFDYLEENTAVEANKKSPILFAGNLGKAPFLEKLSINTKIDLFGINQAEKYPKNIDYQGAYPPNELASHLNGSFGLIWDGDSIHECDGIIGKYMQFNNPHKTSLYLALGIPIIIWDQSALADFITEHQIGFTINDLKKLDNKLANISDEEYELMRKNAMQLSIKLQDGFFIKKALSEVETSLKGVI